MRQLRAGDVELLRALIPGVMSGVIAPDDTAAVDRTLQSFDGVLNDLSPGAVGQIRQAFDALQFAPTRGLLAGRWGGWATASVDDVHKSLARLRESSFSVSNAIYGAVVRLIGTSYYVLPEHWASTGYPGAPQKVVQAPDQGRATP